MELDHKSEYSRLGEYGVTSSSEFKFPPILNVESSCGIYMTVNLRSRQVLFTFMPTTGDRITVVTRKRPHVFVTSRRTVFYIK